MAARKKKKSSTKKRRSSKAADRSRVAGKQRYEVYYLARKHGVSADDVRAAIKKVGHSRKKVEAALEKM